MAYDHLEIEAMSSGFTTLPRDFDIRSLSSPRIVPQRDDVERLGLQMVQRLAAVGRHGSCSPHG
jgi:hypothetical protein